jgi:hypothetical protein
MPPLPTPPLLPKSSVCIESIGNVSYPGEDFLFGGKGIGFHQLSSKIKMFKNRKKHKRDNSPLKHQVWSS